LRLALRVALRSKIVLCSASCLAKNPASAIHGYGIRRAEAKLLLFPPHPGDFVNFRPLPPEYSATLVCNQELTEYHELKHSHKMFFDNV
jgi:hypothetical protein